jgi:DNA modification methylase
LSPEQKLKLSLYDNRTAELAEWDLQVLGELGDDVDLSQFFNPDELQGLLDQVESEGGGTEGNTDPDEIPDNAPTRVKPGDIWQLGRHKVACLDSTDKNSIKKLFGSVKFCLVHADPPYGMGKEKDGVLNDNLYKEKLDAFQLAWWKACRPFVSGNGSAYIWGNAEDLWRLWYCGGLKNSEPLTFRNEIVWDKANKSGKYDGNGIGSSIGRSYANISERCLFFMLGEQGFNNNADNYWDGWEPIRLYLSAEMEKCGGQKNWKTALGNQMGKHYFTKSQWCFPTEEAYRKLQTFARGDAFKKEYDDLKQEYDDLKQEWYATRAYFDNTHENMTDLWQYPRVKSEERHGHPTPKPVDMISRIYKSSSPDDAVIYSPFLGSGTDIIAAEQLGRTVYGCELSPDYCDVILSRWENFTGQTAVLLEAGNG